MDRNTGLNILYPNKTEASYMDNIRKQNAVNPVAQQERTAAIDKTNARAAQQFYATEELGLTAQQMLDWLEFHVGHPINRADTKAIRDAIYEVMQKNAKTRVGNYGEYRNINDPIDPEIDRMLKKISDFFLHGKKAGKNEHLSEAGTTTSTYGYAKGAKDRAKAALKSADKDSRAMVDALTSKASGAVQTLGMSNNIEDVKKWLSTSYIMYNETGDSRYLEAGERLRLKLIELMGAYDSEENALRYNQAIYDIANAADDATPKSPYIDKQRYQIMAQNITKQSQELYNNQGKAEKPKQEEKPKNYQDLYKTASDTLKSGGK